MDNTLKPLIFIEKTKTAFDKMKKSKRFTPPDISDVTFFIIALLCGRATLFSLLRPFGGAFFAALFCSKHGYIYIFSALLGQVFAGAQLYEAGKYLFAMTFFALIIEKLPPMAKNKNAIRGGLFASSLALSGFSFMLTSSGGVTFTTLYDTFLLFVECSVAFCATWAFSKAIPVIKRRKLSYSFSTLEEISLVSLFGCALWGAKDISDLGIINLSNVICILIIITFAIRLGSSRGAIAGLTMGLCSALGSGQVDISCVSYAFSALAAGLLGSFGAIVACSGFILTNALITALANGSTEVLINIYDIFVACIIYSIIPEKFLLRLTSFGSRDEKNKLSSDERHYGETVLLNVKNTLLSLAIRTEQLDEARISDNEEELNFCRRLARRACLGCGMRRFCWSRDYNKTTLLLKKALKDYIECGKLKSELLPQNCLRPKELKDAFIHMSEIYRTDLHWKNKIYEIREISKAQMETAAQIVTAASKKLSSPESFDHVLADDILRKLNENGIKCKNAVVLRDADSDPTVLISLEGCGGFSLCEKGARDIISTACGQKMVRAGKKDCGSCNIKYVASPPLSVSFATAKKSRNLKRVSGDEASFRVINKNLYAAVLTDGMGYGEKASLEAKVAADTILDLIEAGLDGESAVKATNSLMLSRGEVSFSSADLCLYDAFERRAKIIKCGSAVSFTKSSDRVDTLYSRSLPLGSKLKNGIETFTLPASCGDIIVMISDGVLESVTKGTLKDAWLIKELEDFNGNSPTELSELILEKALAKCSYSPNDDITVLTAFIN